ncbi:MAG: hypothetical protein ACTHN5_12460 [Phycisphaerae bacterium]
MTNARNIIPFDRFVAHHEAAHAVMMWTLGSKVLEICMRETGHFEAYVSREVSPWDRERSKSLSQFQLFGLKCMCEFLAGPAAEAMLGIPLEDIFNGPAYQDVIEAERHAEDVFPGHDPHEVVTRLGTIVVEDLMPTLWPGIEEAARHLTTGEVYAGSRLHRIKCLAIKRVDRRRLPSTDLEWLKIHRRIHQGDWRRAYAAVFAW